MDDEAWRIFVKSIELRPSDDLPYRLGYMTNPPHVSGSGLGNGSFTEFNC